MKKAQHKQGQFCQPSAEKEQHTKKNSDALTAVDLVGSVTAVTVSIAFSPDVDASAVRAAEFVAGAFFDCSSTSKKKINIM